jgi:hypothetical protein
MSLQTIIDRAESINFNRRKSIALQTTRSEIPKTGETPTRNPWRLTVSLAAALPYHTSRELLEVLDKIDRKTNQTVTFSNNANLSWLLAYQGEMNSTQYGAINVSSFSGNQLVLGNLPTVNAQFPSTKIMFKAGDFIQIAGKPYPFTVTETVLRGSSGTITVTTHRPNFITSSVTGLGLLVGNQVNFTMLCTNMPTYTLLPGATVKSGGQMINNAYIRFEDSFQLYEDTGGA